MKIRTRFAPSPTGFLHIGGVRTALYNWLYAQKHGGEFFLRIEDTDLERSEERFTSDILESMRWLGLTWTGEMLFQSKRMDLYREKAEELITLGLAYRCTATEAELEQMRETAMKAGQKPMYDRRYRDSNLPAPTDGTPYVIRAKIPLTGSIKFDDLIRGEIEVSNEEVDDFVIIRSNGAPTYNFSCVIDDVASEMTHIIRGDDHINNTPKQIHLYRFFNYSEPKFAHLPMILGSDKKKLSKRHGAVSANQYRADGYLPETVLNFLARIGWSHGDQEVFTIPELVAAFSFDHVQKASGVFNPEKLLWLSAEHIRRADPVRVTEILKADFSEKLASVNLSAADAVVRLSGKIGQAALGLLQPKAKTILELADLLQPLLSSDVVPVDASGLKWNKDDALKMKTKGVIETLLGWGAEKVRASSSSLSAADLSLFDLGLGHAEIDAFFREQAEKSGVKLGDLVQPLRLVLSGKAAGASVFDLLSVLPWNVCEKRIAYALTL
jgi:glutamyl-tRNA synthetase